MSAQPDPIIDQELFGSLFEGPASKGPEFSYDEILQKAREAIGGDDFAPSPDHPVGQMQADLADAFVRPEPEAEPEF